jgi:hypothetical protein
MLSFSYNETLNHWKEYKSVEKNKLMDNTFFEHGDYKLFIENNDLVSSDTSVKISK